MPQPAAVVMFSGGRGSWAAGRAAVERYGADNIVLLFADTLVEDEDTYRFLREAAAEVGAPLVTVADGRTPFQVFQDERWLGNSRTAHCSVKLKAEPCAAWMEQNAASDTTVVVGIDWTETHRMPAIVRNWAPRPVWAPLTEPPYLSGDDLLRMMEEVGLRPPAAYAEGFPHANCLAQGCVKGGQAYWSLMLKRRPEVFHATEAAEQEIRDLLGDVSMLTDRRGGIRRPLPLAQLRDRLEAQPELIDDQEWGGCGCFVDATQEQ